MRLQPLSGKRWQLLNMKRPGVLLRGLWWFCAVLGWLAATSAHAQTLPTAPASAPKSLTVVLDDNYPPYIFRNPDGELQGLLKDQWDLWQQHTGVPVQLLAMDWALAQAVMASGRADVIDTLFKTPARQQRYDFDASYATMAVSLYFHQSIGGITDTASVRGFSVGVKDGDACIELLQSSQVRAFQRYASYSALVDAAIAGDVRVFCMDQPPANYLLAQRGRAGDFRHSAPISNGEFHRAVKKGDLATLRLVQGGFAAIGAAEQRQLNNRWLGFGVLGLWQTEQGQRALQAAVLVAVLALALVLWSLTLRQRVAQRTRSLTESMQALRQTRDELQAALLEQQALLDNEMVGLIKLAADRVAWANPAIALMFGYTPDEMAGVGMRALYPSDLAFQQFGQQASAAMAQGRVFRALAELRHRDGSARWVEVSGVALKARSGEALWTFMDVTAQHSAQAARDEASVRLHKLANRVPGLLYQYLLRPDGSSCFPFANEWIRNIYHISPAEAQVDAAGAMAAIHPQDLVAVMTSIQNSARQLTPWQQEYRARFADGSVRWLYGSSAPERLDDGSVLWHGFITDITERKAADDRLRQLSRSVEQAPVSIVITDLDGAILYVNPRFTSNTGYTLNEAQGCNPRILKSGLTPPERYVELWDTLLAGQVWQGELHNRKKSGEVFVEHAVIAPVLDAFGNTSHYVAIKEDISLRKAAEQALQASLQEKVALLHEVHHRVKNNLQVITSLLRLETYRSASPETRGVLKEMQGRILAMALLHESLYRTGSFAAVELAAYLKQLATQAFRAQSGIGNSVRLQLDLACVQVVMDQATPCGLLVNELISNCLKHAFADGRSGTVELRSQPGECPGCWRVCVCDDGIGLPDDLEQRRAQSLGLQLVSDLAAQLGGELQVLRQPQTIFSVEFPLQSATPAPAAS